jgi:hypothetical protein
MKLIDGMLALTISLAFALPICADTAHDLNEAGFWLEAKSQQLCRQSRITMHDGTLGFKPSTDNTYPLFFVRDYAYMLEGCPEAFTATELRNASLFFINAIGTFNGTPNCSPEYIGPDGTVYHKPAWDNPAIANATADTSQFNVDVAWRTYQATKDTSFVNQTIDRLVATMYAVPRSANGLVWINPNASWDRAPYGFTDSVRKTGNELYCSLLDVRASNQLADLLDVAGRSSDAATWRALATSKTTAIQSTFWDPANTPGNPGLFYAATVKNHQFDVWGSALAVQMGVATADQTTSIANYFNNNYSTMVLSGQIREIPTTAPYWQDSVCGQGTNQNGGYWGVATGQFATALSVVNPTKAQQTLLDMVNFYKQKNTVPEYTDAGNANGAQGYVSSATLPLVQFKPYMTAQPVLTSMGGSLTAAKDVALQSNGGTAFAKDCIAGFSQHSIPHLNDGIYGNSNSWIGNSQSNFAGVAFNQAYTIDSLAFGRDNGGESTTYTDRYTGTYIFQYTTVANPNASTSDSDWTSFGGFYFDTLFPNTTNECRHLYEFDPISGVTGVRILTCSDGSSFADYTCIDEIEVYASAVPEPGTLTLAIGCLVGLIGCTCWKRRRRAQY